MKNRTNCAADTLQAVLLYRDAGRDHTAARAPASAFDRWLDGLSHAQRRIADLAVWAHDTGNEASAEKILASLPPAPLEPAAESDL
jgi:hypothetical protein